MIAGVNDGIPQPFWEAQLPVIVLIGSTLVGAAIIAAVAKWRKKAASEAALSASDQLAQFRSLYLEGAISKEEFERLRSVLGKNLRQELEVPAAPDKPAADTPEESQPSPQNQDRANRPANDVSTS